MLNLFFSYVAPPTILFIYLRIRSNAQASDVDLQWSYSGYVASFLAVYKDQNSRSGSSRSIYSGEDNLIKKVVHNRSWELVFYPMCEEGLDISRGSCVFC